jgi:hypothetical protein
MAVGACSRWSHNNLTKGTTRVQAELQRLAAAQGSQTLRHWFVTQYINAMQVLPPYQSVLVSLVSNSYTYVSRNLQFNQVLSYCLEFDSVDIVISRINPYHVSESNV